jgi:glycosyltransferase involved in cell wall biosynthesis
MEKRLKCSVIIPAKNAAPFLRVALESALSQTLADLEVIVVDDGSTDGTAQLIRNISLQDTRVKLIGHPVSRGVSAARNAAIASASGAWVAPLDADDAFKPDRLAKMIALAEARSLDLLADNLELVDFDNGQTVGVGFPDEWMNSSDLLSIYNMLERDTPGAHEYLAFGFCKPIIRRAFLESSRKQYSEDIWFAEDFLLYCELILEGARFGVSDYAGYLYSLRAGSASRSDGTKQMIEVNRRLSEAARGEARNHMTVQAADVLIKSLRYRELAIRYDHLARMLKTRSLLEAGLDLLRLPPQFLALRMIEACRRRVARLPQGPRSGL